ncbi:uncharacterized protein LOC113648637 [Tachysurus ichikawai]
MSRIKQKQPHSPAQPTTRATVSIADLENRSRRANLRIVKVPEGSENSHDPITFIAGMLLEMTGTEVFDKPPALERAHRSPGQKPVDGRKPRPFVVCFHRFQEKEQLLRWST